MSPSNASNSSRRPRGFRRGNPWGRAARNGDLLLEPDELRRYLKAHRLPPLERFGQHFLVDEGVLRDMVAASENDPAVPIIELGAGLGVLTRALARERERKWRMEGGELRMTPLIAVELDRRLIPLLKERTREFPSVQVVQADILRFPVSSLQSLVFDVVGNLPYNLTGAILKKFLGTPPRPRRMTLLLDESVADAIAAKPPDLSLRAVSVQAYATPRIVRRRIPPSAFVPPPAVKSATVTLIPDSSFQLPAVQERPFFRLVRAGFSQKRKMLANSLAATYRLPPTEAAARLRAAGIDPRRRAETLSLAEWKHLLEVWEKPVVH